MKKYVRDILDDLRNPKNPDFIPPTPQPSGNAPLPDDLENQELSNDPAERVRQLDQQAQDAEIRETLE